MTIDSDLIERSEQEPETPQDEVDLTALRRGMLVRLAQAADAAAVRLLRAAAGESVFDDDAQARLALALVRFVPELLPLLESCEQEIADEEERDRAAENAEAEDEAEDEDESDTDQALGCGICGAGPGSHEPKDCPRYLAEMKARGW